MRRSAAAVGAQTPVIRHKEYDGLTGNSPVFEMIQDVAQAPVHALYHGGVHGLGMIERGVLIPGEEALILGEGDVDRVVR